MPAIPRPIARRRRWNWAAPIRRIPASIAAFLVSDPPLKQVVSRTVEAGFRGTKELNIGTLGWKLGGFPRHQHRRHPRHSEPGAAGIRLFPERRLDPPPGHRGRSQSQIEDAAALCQLRVRRRALPRCAAGRLQQPVCRCRTATSRSCPATGSRRSRVTGSRPASTIRVTDAFKVGGDALFVSSQYFVGDESNQAPRLPSYTVFNVHASYQINKTFQIYGRVDNVFDNRYATYGTFFDTDALPNFANGGAPFTDPRSVSPARPRAFYAGLKATF